jgi:hypothetical protein
MSKLPETDDFVVDLRNQSARKQESNKTIKQNEETSFSQKKSWLNFVQYNNAFLLLLVVCILAFGSLTFASENVRDATIGGKQVLAEGVDNTLLLEQDFDKFNMDFKITGILEDEENYTVSYSYVDFDIAPSSDAGGDVITNSHELNATNSHESGEVWQFVEKQGARKISKPFRQDLGVYLASQLSQEAQARVKELKNLQKQEREKGETKIVQVTQYSGLIGKVLDLSSAVFPGYEPVKKIELPTPAANAVLASRTQTSGSADNLTNIYNDYVAEHPDQVAELNGDAGAAAESPASGRGDSAEAGTGDSAEAGMGDSVGAGDTATSTTSSETQNVESDEANSTPSDENTGEENTVPAVAGEVISDEPIKLEIEN